MSDPIAETCPVCLAPPRENCDCRLEDVSCVFELLHLLRDIRPFLVGTLPTHKMKDGAADQAVLLKRLDDLLEKMK